MKRVFDFTLALVALIMLSPLIALVAGLVRINLGNPIFFSQVRAGLNCKPFRMIKFRTMRPPIDATGKQLSDSERLTKFGRILRSSSLDELPELINVLAGHMSIVGPRPLLMEYVPLYSVEQIRRHNVRPGITGWAQIHGRNQLNWEEKFELDVWYVHNHSWLIDIKIITLTFFKVLSREGINAEDNMDVKKFTGSKNCQN